MERVVDKVMAKITSRQLVDEGKRSLDDMLDRQVPDREEAK